MKNNKLVVLVAVGQCNSFLSYGICFGGSVVPGGVMYVDDNGDDDDDDDDDGDDGDDGAGTRFSVKPKEEMVRSSELHIHRSVGQELSYNKNPWVLKTLLFDGWVIVVFYRNESVFFLPKIQTSSNIDWVSSYNFCLCWTITSTLLGPIRPPSCRPNLVPSRGGDNPENVDDNNFALLKELVGDPFEISESGQWDVWDNNPKAFQEEERGSWIWVSEIVFFVKELKETKFFTYLEEIWLFQMERWVFHVVPIESKGNNMKTNTINHTSHMGEDWTCQAKGRWKLSN